MISANNNRKISLAFLVLCYGSQIVVVNGISIPFFNYFRQQPQEQKEARIINADHGGGSSGVALSPSSSSSAFLAGGSFVPGPSPWISGTRDQFIRDQLVILHPDSPQNRDVWKESGYLNQEETEPVMSQDIRTLPSRLRKHPPGRKSKQHPTNHPQQQEQQQQQETVPNTAESLNSNVNPGNLGAPPSQATTFLQQSSGGLYENALPPSLSLYRDLNNNNNNGELSSDDAIQITGAEGPIFIPANNYLLPITSPFFPYSPRGYPMSHSTLPQEAVIQLLKSPEQELSPQSFRPQVKLPFPLSHDCSSGSSGSRPLQFVVLPIVEPVTPLKPIFPKPPFLSSQYGQFPYIPPFNLFNKKPSGLPTYNLDGISNGPQGQQGGPSSGQFVPILNRPAPPLPFVFVQSLPLELIGQNQEMDILHASSPHGTALESQINEVTPVAAPLPPSPSPGPRPLPLDYNVPNQTRPLPLIVIEKVKKPGQPPSAPVGQAAAVVEISKQSIQKNAAGGSSSGSPPLSTISVVQPITAPGSAPHTPEQQQEIHKAIEKLVPIAASVLENVEQQKQQKDGKDQEGVAAPFSLPPTTHMTFSEQGAPKVPVTSSPITDLPKQKDQEKSSSLRPPLRPESTQEKGVFVAPPPNKVPQKVPVMQSSASEEIVGIGVNPTSMTHEVEITEA